MTSHLSEAGVTTLLYGRLSGDRTRDDRSDGVGDARLEDATGGVLGREFGPIDLIWSALKSGSLVVYIHKESNFSISAWEYDAPITVADLPEVCREVVGRLRQKGDADLLLQSIFFFYFGHSSDIRTRIGLVRRRVSLRYPHSKSVHRW